MQGVAYGHEQVQLRQGVLQCARPGHLPTLNRMRAGASFPAMYCCAWCGVWEKTRLCCTATRSQSKALAEENAALRSLTGRLEGELEEIKTVRARSLVNDGAELQVRAT